MSEIQKTNKQNQIFDTREIVETLQGLMIRVTESDVNASTVNAACNCADRITNILRLHLEVQKLSAKKKALDLAEDYEV